MASIKLLGIILFFLTIQQSIQQTREDIDCSHKGNCGTSSASVAKIVCAHNIMGGDSDCSCEEGSACADGSISLASITYAELTDVKCSQYCSDNVGSCAFWKYEDKVFNKACYLMNKDECQSEGEEPCVPDHSNGTPACRSDIVTGGTCIDGTDVTPGITCPGPIDANNVANAFVQKWKCYNPLADVVVVDMYAPNAAMPLHGYCKLDVDGGSCKPMAPEFRFNCVTDENDATKGKWKAADDVVDDGNTIKDKKLQDVTCTAPALGFTSLATQDGRDFICSQKGIIPDPVKPSKFVIPAENYCHMLCDGYDVLTFETSWNLGNDAATVPRGWVYRVSSEADPVLLEDGASLDCWGENGRTLF